MFVRSIDGKNNNGIKHPVGQNGKFLNTYRIILLVALCVLIFYPPFLRGLYFEHELLPTHIYCFVLFLLFLYYKHFANDRKIFKTKLDCAAAGMIVAFALPVLLGQAANIRNAIGEVLKYFNFFAVYIMVRDIASGQKGIKTVLNVLIGSGAGVALFGIDAAAGEHIQKFIGEIVNYRFFDGYVGGRMNSTLQYPNTLAAYLMAIFFIALGMQLETKKLCQKAVFGGAGFVLLLTFVLTYSRGAMLIFPLIYVLFMVVLFDINRIIEAIMSSGSALLISGIMLQSITKSISDKNTFNIWLLVLVGSISAALFGMLAGFIAKLVAKLNKRAVFVGSISALSVIAVILLTGIVIAFNIHTAVELSHSTAETAKYKTFGKLISGVDTDTEYTLSMMLESATPDEKQWACNIAINSLDKDGKSSQLKTVSYYNENRRVEIPFGTKEDTQSIRVTVTNYYPGTALKIDDAKLVSADGTVKKVALKYKYIPNAIIERFDDLIAGSSNTYQRVVYYTDGFKIFRDFPIFGAGGKAWESLYYKYQSYWYHSTQAHNYFLQTLIETGVIGFMALFAFAGLLLYTCAVNIKRFPNSIISSTAGVAAVSLFIHSAIDFDFSLAAVLLVVWIAAGIIAAVRNMSEDAQAKAIRRPKFAEIAVCAVLFTAALAVSASFTIALVYAQKAVKAVENKNIPKAQKNYETAIKYDPFRSAYRIDLSRIYNVSAKQKDENNQNILNGEMAEKAEKMAVSAIARDKYNSTMYALTGSVYMSTGKVEEGLKYVDKSVEYQPMKSLNYQQKADAYFKAGLFYASKGNKDKAVRMFETVADIEPYVEQLNSGLRKPIKLSDETIKIIRNNEKIVETLSGNEG